MKSFLLSVAALLIAISISAQDLSVHYAELTAPEFLKAIDKSVSTAIIPMGILEKHGPHLPLGTDMIVSREIATRAAEQEYTIVFPQYYFGQIFEAKHQPGTVSYSQELMWNILQETCDELSRNGIKKIILVNGHGGNNNFIPFFCQSQLAAEKDYSVIWFRPDEGEDLMKKVQKLRTTTTGGHADEEETSMMLAVRPDLVQAELANLQSGEDKARLKDLPYGYTGIWWYASYPNHYAGNGSTPKAEIGELLIDNAATQLAVLIRYLKDNDKIRQLQDEFFDKAGDPLKTAQ